ncbi:MAG: exodeoxyribonuclease III [Candidatus Diapherotrites archaeon]|nr:exodeoxyribonuclease III [Candidatus Diapherotrites archaeon]
MNLISWNVNGIRACTRNGFSAFMEKFQPDVLAVQEIKATPEQANLKLEGYGAYWNPAEKKGYSGTAVFTKVPALSTFHGIGLIDHDKEGRTITVEFKDFFLVNVYTPNAQHGLTRLNYRMEWDEQFRHHLQKLEEKKPVIFCGDLNVAHQEIDLANPRENRENAGFTDEERESFTKTLSLGYLDSFREFHPEPRQYSWWSYRFNARTRNIGWRIDYFGVSQKLKNRLTEAFILPSVHGSDHCPVGIELKEEK